MPQQTFRGDPYRVLDVDPDGSDATIKRRWRQLARDLHPDRAGGDATKTADLTKRMARVNAAYDLLRDADRRASYDAAHPNAGAGRWTAAREAGRRGASPEQPRPGGPPVRLPGEQAIARQRQAQAEGVPLADSVVKALRPLVEAAGQAWPAAVHRG